MGKSTNIEWCDATFNHIRGCSKVSPACKNCYAMELVNRFGGDFLGRRVVAAEKYWKEPLKWNREAANALPRCSHCQSTNLDQHSSSFVCMDCQTESLIADCIKRPRVFCASLADVFEDWDGPIHDSKGEVVWNECAGQTLDMNDVRDRLFRLIYATPNLDWLILTKRPENILKMWPMIGFPDPEDPNYRGGLLHLSNVWLGTTVENQEQADKRIPELLKCRDMAPVLFLSCEPLLGPVDLSEIGGNANRHPYTQILESQQINWIIVGGESGKDFRPMPTEWAQSLHDQCAAADVPFFCKQGAGPKSGLQYDLPSELFSVKQFPKS